MCIGRRFLPCSERLLRPRQDPSTDARDDKDDFCFQRSFDCALFRAPENRSEARFLGRGAAGASGKAASIARCLPWRLAGDESAERRFARANRHPLLRGCGSLPAGMSKRQPPIRVAAVLVCPPGIEPGTYSVGGCHSIQLRYGHICRPFGLLLL